MLILLRGQLAYFGGNGALPSLKLPNQHSVRRSANLLMQHTGSPDQMLRTTQQCGTPVCTRSLLVRALGLSSASTCADVAAGSKAIKLAQAPLKPVTHCAGQEAVDYFEQQFPELPRFAAEGEGSTGNPAEWLVNITTKVRACWLWFV